MSCIKNSKKLLFTSNYIYYLGNYIYHQSNIYTVCIKKGQKKKNDSDHITENRL